MRTAQIACLLTIFVSGLGFSSSTPVTVPKTTTYTSELSGMMIDIGGSAEAEFYPEYSQVQQLENHQEEHIALYHGVSLIYITITDASQSPADRNEDAHTAQAPSVVAYMILNEYSDATSRWFLVDMRYQLDFARIR